MTTKITKKSEPKAIERRDDSSSPAEMIRLAVSGGADLEKLEKLLELQERWEANEAKKAYHEAMARFKENPLRIIKDKHVNFATQKGRMDYRHATLANVVETITAELGKHGLSASWKTNQNGKIVVTCKITHLKGHSEETTLSADADTSGLKNSIQAMGSTITYLQRYTLLSALGLATRDQDNDANNAPVEYVDENQIITICDYLAAVQANEEAFFKYLSKVAGVEISCVEEIPKHAYTKAISALKAKEKKS